MNLSDLDIDFLMSSTLTKLYLLTNTNGPTSSAREIVKRRYEYGEFHHLYKDLRNDDKKFREYMRMSIETFDYICHMMKPELTTTWLNCHPCPIGIEERIMLTIRYLSTGMSFRGLSFSFRMGVATVSTIIKETVILLWKVLAPIHMPVPTQNAFKKIANDFQELWNFPHCVGAMDSKHIRINCPKHSGAMFYNYKNFFSIVLQGVVDANYKFINIEVGGYGKQSDGGTFRVSAIQKMIQNKTLLLPDDELPGTDIVAPYVLIADDAYPLSTYLLKPYSGTRLSPDQEYFNSTLSRATRTVECAFCILYSKWRILAKSIETKVETADNIVKSICLLHNLIIDREGMEHNLIDLTFFPKNTMDRCWREALNSCSKCKGYF